jgi:hypothetical protein
MADSRTLLAEIRQLEKDIALLEEDEKRLQEDDISPPERHDLTKLVARFLEVGSILSSLPARPETS